MLTINRMSYTDLEILTDLRFLAEEARKCKSVEEFGNSISLKRITIQVRQVKRGIGFKDELIGGISQIAYSTKETVQQLEEFLKHKGYSSVTDFYNQARQ